VQEQINVLGVKLLEEGDEVHQRTSQAVDRPSGHHVDLAARDGLQQLREPWAVVAALDPGDARVLVNVTTCQPCRSATAFNSRR
jgi:hypothetical protein